MKKLHVLFLFLCLGILCTPMDSHAHEGFAWKVLSDESGQATEDTTENTPAQDTEQITEESSNENETAEENTPSEEKQDESDAAVQADTGNTEEETSQEENSAQEQDNTKPHSIYSDAETTEMIRAKYRELDEAYEMKNKFKKTKTIDSIDSFILNFCGDPLKGKTIVFLGDSITAGNGGTLTPDGSGLDYTNFIAKYTSARIINLGIGGAPFEGSDNDDAIVHRYGDIPEDADIIVLFAGINDLFAGSENFGSLKELDEGTYCGDIYRTFRQIHRLHPHADVHVVITYPNRMENYEQFRDEDWQDYADVQINLADRYDFHVINLYEEGFMDNADYKIRNAFFKDDIHPDDLGSEVLGRHILVHLIEKYVS